MTTSTLRREVLMPRLVPSMADGRIERWHVAEGQSVAVGDVLAEIATSSATMEIEAKAEGRVERILVPAGTAGIKVNTPIAILLDEAEGAPSSGIDAWRCQFPHVIAGACRRFNPRTSCRAIAKRCGMRLPMRCAVMHRFSFWAPTWRRTGARKR